MIIAITGASGLVGTALASALEGNGHLVRRLVRRDVRDDDHEIRWDPEKGEIDAGELEGLDGVIHLAGENIAAGRWTEAKKRRIVESRVEGTRLLCETLAKLKSKPEVVCSASAIGYYGDRGAERVSEASPGGTGFLADVCREWELATQVAREVGIRVVNMRIGVVLSGQGGALARMVTPFKLGLGGVLGSGEQYFSWIAIDDLVEAIRFLLETATLAGPVNCVAPEAVTNRQFTKTLGRVLGRPTIFPMPASVARLAFGEMADEMLLGGACVVPQALTAAGFRHRFPELEKSLRYLLLH